MGLEMYALSRANPIRGAGGEDTDKSDPTIDAHESDTALDHFYWRKHSKLQAFMGRCPQRRWASVSTRYFEECSPNGQPPL